MNSPPRPDETNRLYGENGENGGNGILVDYPIMIDNTNSTIAGGGGGGGAGYAMVLGMMLILNIQVVVVVVHNWCWGSRGYIHEFVNGVEYYFTDSNSETAGQTATKQMEGYGYKIL